MICYIYDNSFEGLLTSIYEAYYRSEKPSEIIREKDYSPTLISKPIYIKTDREKYLKVEEGIKKKISTRALNNIYFTYLSDLEGVDTKIFNYIKLGFKLGKELDEHLYRNEVKIIHDCRRKVLLEKHRFLGFIRFKESGDFLYAAITPDHNILHLLMPHFVSRFPEEQFIIHDLKRSLGAFYKEDKWQIFDLRQDALIPFTQEEYEYEKLWQVFFKTIAIDNRLNPKVQKSFMPVRYWNNLNEFKKQP